MKNLFDFIKNYYFLLEAKFEIQVETDSGSFELDRFR